MYIRKFAEFATDSCGSHPPLLAVFLELGLLNWPRKRNKTGVARSIGERGGGPEVMPFAALASGRARVCI
jgi:hypothetical protein